jgi:hypothetical protein
MADNFQDLTAEDFEAPRPAGTNPATGKPFTTEEVSAAVFGPKSSAAEIEPSFAKRVMAGAGRSMQGKARGLAGEKGPLPGAELEEDVAGQIGALLPDVVGSMAAPARVVPQAAYGFATRAMEPADNLLERGVVGLKGAAEFGGGQALAAPLVRGANALAGNLSREGQVASAAGAQGLDLSAGDITGSKLLRLLEERSFASPTAQQGDQVARLMKSATDNPITNAVKNAYDAAQTEVSSVAKSLDEIIAQNSLPGVVPRKTYDLIRQIKARSPDTLNNVRDPELRAMLEDIANYPANRIPKSTNFEKMDELRKALGPVVAKVEQQSKSGASNITTADANRWKQLYKGILDDFDSWGSSAATEEALATHKQLRDAFKQKVLPLREHPIAGKIVEDAYERPEDIIRDLISPRNRTIIGDLYERLDQGGKNAFDALRATQRGGREFVRGEPSSAWSRPLALGAGLSAPAWAPHVGAVAPWALGALAAEQGLVHGLNTAVGRRILGGSPEAAQSPLLNAAIQSGLRTALPRGGLEALRQERQ